MWLKNFKIIAMGTSCMDVGLHHQRNTKYNSDLDTKRLGPGN